MDSRWRVASCEFSIRLSFDSLICSATAYIFYFIFDLRSTAPFRANAAPNASKITFSFRFLSDGIVKSRRRENSVAKGFPADSN